MVKTVLRYDCLRIFMNVLYVNVFFFKAFNHCFLLPRKILLVSKSYCATLTLIRQTVKIFYEYLKSNLIYGSLLAIFFSFATKSQHFEKSYGANCIHIRTFFFKCERSYDTPLTHCSAKVKSAIEFHCYIVRNTNEFSKFYNNYTQVTKMWVFNVS